MRGGTREGTSGRRQEQSLLLLGFVAALVAFAAFSAVKDYAAVTGGATSATGSVEFNLTAIIVTSIPNKSFGGGSSGATASNPSFVPVERSFSITMGEGDVSERSLTITNNGPLTQLIQLSSTLAIIAFPQPEILLRPGQSATVSFTVLAAPPGVYVGKIILKSGVTREIPIVIAVQSQLGDFGLSAELPEIYRAITTPAILPIQITLEATTSAMIRLSYSVRDAANEVVVEEQEYKSVTKTTLFTKSLTLDGLPPGTYVLVVEASVKGSLKSVAIPLTVLGGEQPLVEAGGMPGQTDVATVSKDRSLLLFLALLIVAWLHHRLRHRLKRSGERSV